MRSKFAVTKTGLFLSGFPKILSPGSIESGNSRKKVPKIVLKISLNCSLITPFGQQIIRMNR